MLAKHFEYANVAGNQPGARQGRGETWRRGAGWGVPFAAKSHLFAHL